MAHRFITQNNIHLQKRDAFSLFNQTRWIRDTFKSKFQYVVDTVHRHNSDGLVALGNQWTTLLPNGNDMNVIQQLIVFQIKNVSLGTNTCADVSAWKTNLLRDFVNT